MHRFEKGMHIPVDDLREWVVSGISHPMDWNDETLRQFQLAEEGASRIAALYSGADFAVAIDHCIRLERMDATVSKLLGEFDVTKVLLLPSLDVNLERNAVRQNKDFDPAVLVPIIRGLNAEFHLWADKTSDWLVLDSGLMDPGQLVDAVLGARR